MRKQWKQRQTLFSWTPKSLQMVTAAMKLKDTPVFTGCHPSCWHGDQPIFGGSPTLETHSQKSHAALILPTGDHGTPLQYSCPENPMNGGAWWAVVHGVAKSRTQLSDFIFTFHFPALEKEMATHSSVLAWRIPGTGEPGGLPSTGSHRVGRD